MPTSLVLGIYSAPTYKATHEFVSGTPGKDLPQEVKALLPADQTDLKDGSQATPTQPSKTEVKTAEGTWSFKSYDKASETINGAGMPISSVHGNSPQLNLQGNT